MLVELLCAFAPLRQPHDGHHLGAQAGAPLLVACQRRGVRAAAAAATGAFLQTVHGPRDAGGAHHVACRHAQPTHAARAGHLHRTAQHHVAAGLEGQKVGAGLKKQQQKKRITEGGHVSREKRSLLEHRCKERYPVEGANVLLCALIWV